MPYKYGIKNKFTPTSLAPNAYGWSRGASYSEADVPATSMWGDTGLSIDVLRQQFAYEWFQSGDVQAGYPGGSQYANPPFLSGAAGRLHPLLRETTGGPARILRGYIRRSEYDATDNTSKARLYFMYNPEQIVRDYQSYLNQDALDPFNTVYQSGNLVAPPSIMNFSFELFFDRQEEAVQADHPGVFVDYQFFDLVVRNVIPTDPNATNTTLVDNGIMMVNPRDIAIIFSPQLTVQGRPTNARITFERFTHRMVPTRMRIQLTILATYFGPVKDMVAYKKEELPAEEAIGFDPDIVDIPVTFSKIEEESDGYTSGSTTAASGGTTGYAAQLGQANDGNHQIRMDALAWVMANTIEGGPGQRDIMDAGWTNYASGKGPSAGSYTKDRHNLPHAADCSGLVTSGYVAIGQGPTMKWDSFPGTANMPNSIKADKALGVYAPLGEIGVENLLPGDILIWPGSPGHTVFVVSVESATKVNTWGAHSSTNTPEVGHGTWKGAIGTGSGKFSHLLRPTPLGAAGSAARASSYNDPPLTRGPH